MLKIMVCSTSPGMSGLEFPVKNSTEKPPEVRFPSHKVRQTSPTFTIKFKINALCINKVKAIYCFIVLLSYKQYDPTSVDTFLRCLYAGKCT